MASFTATVVLQVNGGRVLSFFRNYLKKTVIPFQALALSTFAAVAAMAADESTKTSSEEPAEPRPTTAATTAATTTAGESKDVSILKQINRVNDDGSYTFGYEASDGSFKVETRDVAGNVKGMFGFVDEAGRLKRVSYSASNSSGFQATSREGSRKLREKNDGGGDYGNGGGGGGGVYGNGGGRHGVYGNGGGGEHGVYGNGDGKPSAVKKVLVSKRPVPQDEPADGRRGGYDLRRQLPKHGGGGGVDAPDVYGVHGRSGTGQQSVGPVSPVVSALMSELDPAVSYHGPRRAAVAYEPISRRAQEDDDDGGGADVSATPQYHRAAPPVRYRQPAAAYPPVAYQPVAYQPVAGAVPYGAGLTALRDELMELILSFVQTRVAQLMSAAPYRYQPPPPVQPYPMPYQQPNYYVPSYYQGPRVSGLPQQDGYVAGQQQAPARVTQTLKDGLIRMLLATSPRYDPDRIAGERAPRLTYRRAPQPTPVRNVQVIGGGDDDGGGDRPVTTESPD